MTDNEMRALGDVAGGAVLFHNGLWGGPMGFVWADSDSPRGAGSGHVPEWESETLELLERRHLISIEPGTGARDVHVYVTESGRRLLASVTATVAA